MILAVIPARFASTRFPGKPLVDIRGKSMIQRVYEQVRQSEMVGATVVATDDLRIYEHVKAFGGHVVMTLDTHVSGTDRCAEVAKKYENAAYILNVQGDEPFVQPQQIDLLAETLLSKGCQIATLVKRIDNPEMLFNPNVVKAVVSEQMLALYFSRHPVPFFRGRPENEWLAHHNYYKHIGLYGFERKTLLELTQLPVSALERAESLEQLRWLEHGYRIAVSTTDLETIGIDTPEDLLKIQANIS